MEKSILYKLFIPNDRNLENIADEAIRSNEDIITLLDGIKNENVRIRYGSLNTLVLISKKEPKSLYPHFDVFSSHLDSDNNIIKLAGIKILSNLSQVDEENKFDEIFERYYSFISDPGMTVAAEVSKGSSTIAKAKPYLTEMISHQLLKVAETTYKSEECKNILIGHVITSIDKFFNQLTNVHPVINFVKVHRKNTWKATKIKAEKFLEKHKDYIY